MELMDQKERRGMNIKGFMKKNWLLIATVIAVVLGMYGDLHTRPTTPVHVENRGLPSPSAMSGCATHPRRFGVLPSRDASVFSGIGAL